MIDKTWLEQQILGFMVVAVDCLDSTTYANDRSAYEHDISLIAKWLIELHKGVSADQISDSILSRQTDKSFGDYRKQGEWGEKELSALKRLQTEIKQMASET